MSEDPADPNGIFAYIEQQFSIDDNEISKMSKALAALAWPFMARGKLDIAKQIKDYARRVDDLRNGKVHPMFNPPRHKTDSSEAWVKRAKIAVAVEATMRTGMNREKAARWVADRTDADWKSILSWRDEFAKKRIKNKSGILQYDWHMTWLRDVPRGGELDYINFLLERRPVRGRLELRE